MKMANKICINSDLMLLLKEFDPCNQQDDFGKKYLKQ